MLLCESFFLSEKIKAYKLGPLAVISRMITPLIGVITPAKATYWGPIYNWYLDVPGRLQKVRISGL